MNKDQMRLFACYLAQLLADGKQEPTGTVAARKRNGELVSYLMGKYQPTYFFIDRTAFPEIESALNTLDLTVIDDHYAKAAEENALCGLLCLIIDQLL